MPFPVISAISTRRGGTGRKKPSANGPAMIMLIIATLFDSLNILFGILDFLIIGLILGPIVNGAATIIIGGWLWIITGNFPLKKGLGPLLGNSIPFSKFIPWWMISVATSLNWKGDVTQKQPQERPRQETQQPADSLPKAAKAPA